MSRATCWMGPVGFAVCVLVLAGAAPGQDLDAASILYSHGVHAYFDGNVGEAEPCFTRAIALNPNDPRAYYFRGLSRLQLGRDAGAPADLEAGAAAEARQPDRYAIGTALERVQGGPRILLEQYRRQAREAYALHRAEVNRARYERVSRREADVLRQKVAVPLDQLVPPGEAKSLLAGQDVAEPLLAPAATAPAPAEASDTPAAAKVAGDPFADDPAAAAPAGPAASPPDQRPASDAAAPPAEEPAAPAAAAPAEDTTPAAKSADTGTDPFGLDGGNPFQ